RPWPDSLAGPVEHADNRVSEVADLFRRHVHGRSAHAAGLRNGNAAEVRLAAGAKLRLGNVQAERGANGHVSLPSVRDGLWAIARAARARVPQLQKLGQFAQKVLLKLLPIDGTAEDLSVIIAIRRISFHASPCMTKLAPTRATMKRLDEIDRAILRELQKNGRLSNAELAERVG